MFVAQPAATPTTPGTTVPGSAAPTTPSVVIDPFEGLEVQFDGISPFATVSVNNSRVSNDAQLNVEYSLSSDELTMDGRYALGDTVTVYASLSGGSAATTMSLSQTQRDYVVKGVSEYLTELTPDIDLTTFKQELDDYLTSITAFTYDAGVLDTGCYYSYTVDFSRHDSYFGTLKYSSHDRLGRDLYYFNSFDNMYSVIVQCTNGQEGDPDAIYFSIRAFNMIRFPDGTIGWGENDPASLSFEYVTEKRTSLEDLIAKTITSQKADYNFATVTNLMR
jgi:hypothetical protein